MAQSKEDIARALAALAGGEVEPSEAPPGVTPIAPETKAEPVKKPEAVKKTEPVIKAEPVGPMSKSGPSPTVQNPQPSPRPTRPETPAGRSSAPQPAAQPPRPQPKVAPAQQLASSGRPERPVKPVRSAGPAIQTSSEPESVDFIPSSTLNRTLSATEEVRLRSLRATLALRQLFIPSCLILGGTLPLLAIAWFVLRAADSPMVMMRLPVWAVAVVAFVGVFFAGLSVLFMLSTKTLNQQITELDDKARTV